MGSRVANNPISIPSGVEVKIDGQVITVKGSKGSLTHNLHDLVSIKVEDNVLSIVFDDQNKAANAQAGTARAVLNNIVTGVHSGFERKLTMVGVGYRAKMQGNLLDISAGFSHEVKFAAPEGITIETPSQTEIIVKGCDKQKVGQVAANIRAIRPPEPYKGKGIRYSDEVVVKKETKKK